MSIQLDTSASIILMHEASTAFTGVQIGRSAGTLGGMVLLGRLNGTYVDGYVLHTTVAGDVVLMDPTGKTLFQGKPPALTLTSLAAYINATKGLREFLCAHVVTPGPMVATSATMAGGIEPVVEAEGSRYRMAGNNGGLLYFDQPRAVCVTQVEGNFPTAAAEAIVVELVNLDDGLVPISGESSTMLSTTLPTTKDFCITDARLVLHKFRAIRVTCPLPGKVWATVGQEVLASRV